jgi:DEAD/DEAH box helicase domain-containing protein
MLGEIPLDLPAETLRTQATWWTVPGATLAAAEIGDIAGTVHAAEHAAIGMLPLFTACDRNDIGGLSMAEHPDTGMPTVFIYDGYSGGAGYSWHGYESSMEWLSATAAAIGECSCQSGCPSCVQSPKCGSNNTPLDKSGAQRLLVLASR